MPQVATNEKFRDVLVGIYLDTHTPEQHGVVFPRSDHEPAGWNKQVHVR